MEAQHQEVSRHVHHLGSGRVPGRVQCAGAQVGELSQDGGREGALRCHTQVSGYHDPGGYLP